MPEKNEPRHLRDPREMRALAHPVRMSIVEQLSVHGPATATELADLLHESPANCSWHLRKLAEYGVVEEAEGGQGRRRPWQMTTIGFQSGHEDMSDEEAMAQEALTEMWLERQYQRHVAARRATVRAPEDSFERNTVRSYETGVWVNPQEWENLMGEVSELFTRYRDRLTDPAARPDGAELVELVLFTNLAGIPGSDRRARDET